MCVPEDGFQCSYHTECEVSGKKQIGLYHRNSTGKTTFLQSSTDAMDNPMGIDYLFDRRKYR